MNPMWRRSGSRVLPGAAVLILLCGATWLIVSTGMAPAAALIIGMAVFLPGEAVKVGAVYLVGRRAAMIAIRELRYRCLAIDALEIAPGITSMIGPNGSGKSTFLKICSGIAEPESGTLLIDNESPRLTGIGYVNEFPDRNILFPTVKDELASPLRFRFTPCTETERAVRDCAGSLGIGHLLDRRMQDLSGGEKVLVAFAAAIITRPRVIVLDECDSHLDAGRCRWLEEALRVSGAVYVIRCTQQMETAALGDHLLYLEKGRVTARRDTGRSFSPDIWYVILPALVEVAGTRLVLDHARVHRQSWSLAADGIFSPGIHLVSGDVGSGKSTLALMMAGLYQPASGAVRREEITSTMLSFQFPEFHVTGLSVAEECASWNLSPETALAQAGIDVSPETPALSLSRGELKRLHLACALSPGLRSAAAR